MGAKIISLWLTTFSSLFAFTSSCRSGRRSRVGLFKELNRGQRWSSKWKIPRTLLCHKHVQDMIIWDVTASSMQGLPSWGGGGFQLCGSLLLCHSGFIFPDPAERMNQSQGKTLYHVMLHLPLWVASSLGRTLELNSSLSCLSYVAV